MLSQNTSSSAELLWRPIRRGRDVSSDSSLDPLTSDSVSLLRLASMVGASSTYPQSIQITGQLFPRKLVPKISSRYTRDRERNSQKEMACRDSCFYTLCFQCLTGSWLGRPSCSCFLSECLHTHTRYLWGCTCIYDAIFHFIPRLSCSFWVVYLPGMSHSLWGRCQCSVAAGKRLSWRPISSSTWARRLRLPSGKCWASHKSSITPVGLDLVAK